ncbi:sigma-70 family RNA polymerase sigma factor [Actinomadura sp. KC06]|uniref:RNA polymerase sigma factor n=1 Tax=Actinomadura sp. KC06 TaxID=2530369 RepID=UPI0010458727|nr:sigma-70 family RNA polymerase sigma factor [Actinomadura sp. KC06]TDD33908.1 sigma-70 family RNA polymerase sigma factor [Actinomadura sp. KC06]
MDSEIDAATEQSGPIQGRTETTEIAEIVRRCAAGDAGAWAILIRTFTPVVWTVARSLRLSRADCEDVCQATWLRLAQSIGGLREPAKIGGWLVTTSRREALKVVACREPVPVGDSRLWSEQEDSGPGPEDTALTRCEATRVLEAVRRLPDQHQALMALLLTEPPMSYEAISDALAIPRGSIGPTRRRILRHLADQMKAPSPNRG